MPRYTLRPLPTPLTMRVTKALVTLSPTQTIDAPERPRIGLPELIVIKPIDNVSSNQATDLKKKKGGEEQDV